MPDAAREQLEVRFELLALAPGFLEPRHALAELAVGVGRHVRVGGELRGFLLQPHQVGARLLMAVEPGSGFGAERGAPLGIEPPVAIELGPILRFDLRQAVELGPDRRVVVLQRVDVGIQRGELRVQTLDRVLDPQRGVEQRLGVAGRGLVEHAQRLVRGGVAGPRVGGALQPRLQRVQAAVLLVGRHHLVEMLLAHERALLELLGVEPQQVLADRVFVLALQVTGGELLAAPVPHRHRALVEVADQRVALAAALELQLDAVGAAVPRPPALERRDRPVGALVVRQAVQRRHDRRQQRGLAALVVIDDQRQAPGIEAVLAAQHAEAVGLEPEQLHPPISSHIGVTSRSRNASSP